MVKLMYGIIGDSSVKECRMGCVFKLHMFLADYDFPFVSHVLSKMGKISRKLLFSCYFIE